MVSSSDVDELGAILVRLRGAVARVEMIRDGKVTLRHPIIDGAVELDVSPDTISEVQNALTSAVSELKAKVAGL